MVGLLKTYIKKLKCDHEYEWKENIYGDKINWCGGHRSIWECKKCGKPLYKDYLVEEN